MGCNERSSCPAGIERMDGYLVKMEAEFEVTEGEGKRKKREICLKSPTGLGDLFYLGNSSIIS